MGPVRPYASLKWQFRGRFLTSGFPIGRPSSPSSSSTGGICPPLRGACFVGQRTPQLMTQIRSSEDRTVDVLLCSILRWNWQVAYYSLLELLKGHFRGLLMNFLLFAFLSRKCKVAGYCNQGFVFFFLIILISKIWKKSKTLVKLIKFILEKKNLQKFHNFFEQYFFQK